MSFIRKNGDRIESHYDMPHRPSQTIIIPYVSENKISI